LDPASGGVQPGLISIQSTGCGPLAFTDLTYEMWDDTCGVLIATGSIYPSPSDPIVFGLDTAQLYTLCFSWLALCEINAVCATYYLSVLPVEMVSFSGVEHGDYIELKWITGSEHGASHFSVRRSTDLSSWKLVDVVGAVGNSPTSNTYTTIDRSPVQGVQYYMLSRVDIDGSVDHFRTIAVRYDGKEIGTFLYWYSLNGQLIRE